MGEPRVVDDFDVQPSRKLKKKEPVGDVIMKANEMVGDVIHIWEGQDIREKIIQHVKDAHKASPIFQGQAFTVTILSAIGSVRNFALQVGEDDKYYEGDYTIITLKGELFIAQDGSVEELNNMKMQVSNDNHEVFGGVVIGSLIAGSAIQMVVGFFKTE